MRLYVYCMYLSFGMDHKTNAFLFIEFRTFVMKCLSFRFGSMLRLFFPFPLPLPLLLRLFVLLLTCCYLKVFFLLYIRLHMNQFNGILKSNEKN